MCEPAALITPAIVVCGLAVRRFRIRLAVPVLVSCLIGIALVAVAPGNHARIQSVAVHPTLIAAGIAGIMDMQLFLNNAATFAHHGYGGSAVLHPSGSGWALIALAAVVALAAAFRTSLVISSKVLLAALVCGQFALWVPFFLCRYGIARPAPDRSVIVADFALVAITAFIGLYSGQYVRKWPGRSVGAIIAVAIVAQLAALSSIASIFARPTAMARFASGWDNEDQRIRQGGPIGRPLWNPGDNGMEATDWQLTAERSYYGRPTFPQAGPFLPEKGRNLVAYGIEPR
jgi:hypothetical protein